MIALIIILAILAILASISVILGVINWVQLSTSSSRVAFLEAEVDKKTREFDAIKKDRVLADAQRKQDLSFENNAEMQNSIPGDKDSSIHIEVVRNIRTQDSAFQADEMAQISASNPNSLAPSQQDSLSAGFVSQHSPSENNTAGWQSISVLTAHQQPQPVSQAHQGHEEGNKQGHQDAVPVEQPTPVNIRLFSESTHKADYHTAWQQMTDALGRVHNPYIIIDCSDIVQMSAPELGYLEQFARTVAQYHGYFAIAHCRSEVAAVLQTNSTLVQYIIYQ